MPIVSDLIHSSFRLIGAIAAGETLETNELNDALVSINQLISSWNTEGLSLASRQFNEIPVGPAANSYAIPQPIHIESASLSISGINVPLEIVDAVGWSSIPEQYALSVYVKKLYCDYQYPNSNVALWPTPRVSGQLNLVVYLPILQFLTVNDTVNLPVGYEQALRYNFAMAILPEYPRSQADPTLPAQAQMFKASIVQLNSQHFMRSQTSSATQAAITDTAEAAAR